MATEQLKYLITADTSGFTAALDKLSGKLRAFGKSMTRNVTLPIAAAGTAAVKFASDLEEAITKTDAVFGKSSAGMKKWAQSSATSFGTSKADALEFSSTIGSIAKSLGFSIPQAAEFGKEITELSADFASFHNKSTEVARGGLLAIFTGQAAPLKKFGIILTEVNLQQYALSKGITKSYRDMTQAEKVQLRYNYTLENSKDAQGDFARTSGGLANQVRIASSSLTNLAATIGTALLPLAKKIVLKVISWVTWWKELDVSSKTLYVSLGLIAAAIGPIITAIGFLLTPIGLIIAAIAGITYAFKNHWDVIGPIIVEWTNAFIDVYNKSTLLRVGIAFIWTTVKTLVRGAVAAFKVLGNAIYGIVKAMGQALTGDFSGAKETLKQTLLENVETWADFGKNTGEEYAKAINDAIDNKLEPITLTSLNSKIGNVKEYIENEVKKILKILGIEFKGPSLSTGDPDPTNPVTTPDTSDRFDQLNRKADDALRKVLGAWTKYKDEQDMLFAQIKASVEGLANFLVEGGLVNAFDAIGNAIGTGGNVLKAAGNSLLNTIGQFLSKLGAEAVKFGLLTVGLGKLIKKIYETLFKNPTTAIIAGLALVAIGAAFSGAANKSQANISGGASSANYSTPSATTTTPSSLQGVGAGGSLVATVRGQDLRFVLQAADDSYTALN